MTEFETEMQRLLLVDDAVRIYLSHLAAFEQGAEHDGSYVEHWRGELERLTA